MKSFKETTKLHKMAVHVKDGKVMHVGPDVWSVKAGDKVTSSDMDDLQQAGHKVKEF